MPVTMYMICYNVLCARREKVVLGAVAADIVGSRYEYSNVRTTEFPLFSEGCRYTDDTVLTVATASALLDGVPYKEAYERFARMEPHQDYGARFRQRVFALEGLQPYNSLGNGSAMRVSPIGWYFDSLSEVLEEAERSAACSHNHPEGIKGAQCTAALVWKAKRGESREALVEYAASSFCYSVPNPRATLSAPRGLDETCSGTMPVVLAALALGQSWEECVRIAISGGGDSDTIACITGAIAEAAYGLPEPIKETARSFLPNYLLNVLDAFSDRIGR